ncbi:DUF6138 family protein [Flavobacterium gelatinilyticum]|uniref:DUF6138 family protein n=1 Tax=Flavobacterium gelatinilyticum TaxID=3003260 RepID=UPI00247FAB47|nr:DUF6138 family protein [Flavobacterium gelatinilyticum]
MLTNRNYVLFDDIILNPSLEEYFTICCESVLQQNILVSRTREGAGYPSYQCFKIKGKEIFINDILKYYLFRLENEGFCYTKIKIFADAFYKLCGWGFHMHHPFQLWIKKFIQNPYFFQQQNSFWLLKPGEPKQPITEDYFLFACYIAISHIKHESSQGKHIANQIFSMITRLGSDLPNELQKHGSGSLPEEIMYYQDSLVSCKANDVLAEITIIFKEEKEEAFCKALLFLCQLLKYGFPSSYTFTFKSRKLKFLPISNLPKKDANHFFAKAVQWPSLHEQIEKYARLAMKESAFYNDRENEGSAMPGTFAVFALGLEDEKHHKLVCDYLKICDAENQTVQAYFLWTYIQKYRLTHKAIELYDLCTNNMSLLPRKLLTLRREIKERKTFYKSVFKYKPDDL